MNDSADPLEGWSEHDISHGARGAKNDAYGNLYFYLRKLLGDFCQRLASLRLEFTLMGGSAKELPEVLKEAKLAPTGFDRIEVCYTFPQAFINT